MMAMVIPSLSAATTKMGLWERMQPPEDISVHGHLIDDLFAYTSWLNLFFFLLVCVGLFGFSFLYHHKRHPRPYFTYGNKKPQILVATAIGILVFFTIDLNITRISNDDFLQVFANWEEVAKEVEENKGDVVRVEVMAQQWMWAFRYPGRDDLFNTPDDLLTTNQLHIPTGKKIIVQLLSKDVIHSLYIPNVRLKVDAIPGRITRMWFETTKPGLYDIACAEMCGTFHYKMAAQMIVHSPQDYQAWSRRAQEVALAENGPENENVNASSFWGWKWQN